jgi:hypothetical protein
MGRLAVEYGLKVLDKEKLNDYIPVDLALVTK